MTDKIKDVIEKLKKKQEVKEEPKEEKIEEVKEEPKEKPNEKQIQYMQTVEAMQNNGIYRANLLAELSELNKTLRVLTATIMKATGVEDGQE